MEFDNNKLGVLPMIDFCNHSIEFNSKLTCEDGKIILRCIRDVNEREDVLIDYGTRDLTEITRTFGFLTIADEYYFNVCGVKCYLSGEYEGDIGTEFRNEVKEEFEEINDDDDLKIKLVKRYNRLRNDTIIKVLDRFII